MNVFWKPSDWEAEITEYNQVCASALKELRASLCLPMSNIETAPPLTANQMIYAEADMMPESAFFRRLFSEFSKVSAASAEWVTSAQELTNLPRRDAERHQRMLDEQALRLRRMIEILLILIHCNIANPRVHCQHFFRLSDYVHIRRKFNELSEYYFPGTGGLPHDPLYAGIETKRINQIDALESSGAVNPANCTYEDKSNCRRRITASNFPIKANQILSSTSAMMDSIFSTTPTTNAEKLEQSLLGFSYNGLFGRTSSEVHFSSIGFSPFFVEPMRFCLNITISVHLLACCLVRVFTLTGASAELTACVELRDKINSSAPPSYLSAVGAPLGQAGDLVFVQNPIEQIAQWKVIDQSYTNRAPGLRGGLNYNAYAVRDVSVGVKHWVVPAPDILFYVGTASVANMAAEISRRTGKTFANPLDAVTQTDLTTVLDVASSHNALQIGAALFELTT